MNIKSQRGLSLLGVLVVGALAAFVLIVGFRTVPVVNEYMSIKRIIGIQKWSVMTPWQLYRFLQK